MFDVHIPYSTVFLRKSKACELCGAEMKERQSGASKPNATKRAVLVRETSRKSSSRVKFGGKKKSHKRMTKRSGK